jgi:bacterial/archaeal transporter family-2 protein
MGTTADLWLPALVILAGSLLPLQALVNGRLGAQLESPMWASMAQNLIGAATMACVVLLLRPPRPAAMQIVGAPAWSWVGGALGMVYVFAVMLAAPRMGTARAMVCVIGGQLLSSVLLDHFGVLHERRPFSPTALAGGLLVLAGAAMILRRA